MQGRAIVSAAGVDQRADGVGVVPHSRAGLCRRAGWVQEGGVGAERVVHSAGAWVAACSAECNAAVLPSSSVAVSAQICELISNCGVRSPGPPLYQG